MQVEEFLEISARRLPQKTALVCGEQRLTYAQLEQQCNRLAHGLIACGLRRGDRVAVCFENSVEAALSIFAALKAGGVLMMVNPTTKLERLVYILNNSRAAALISTGEKLASLGDCWAQSPHLRTVVAAGEPPEVSAPGKRFVSMGELLRQHAADTTPPAKTCIDIDLAALIYTSGSTGNPKGVMMTHLNMVSVATSIITYLENGPEDILLDVLPLSFGYGLYQLLTAMKVGGTLVLEKSMAYPHAVLKRMVDERATGFAMVPMIAAMLLQMDLSRYDFSNLRYLTNAGAALPVEHLQRIRKALPQARFYSMYGLTECQRVSYLPPEELDRRPGSVGRGMPNQEVYIADEAGNRVGPGVVGELVVRGAHVMLGYWEMPEETQRVLRPGPLPHQKVLHSGDLFRMDEEGYLYFVSRKDDIIKSRGEKVSPKEVENVLHAMPGVAEAAVVGVPDPILGQAVKAIVVPTPGSNLTRQDVLRHCASHLEDFMVPKHVELRDSLPRMPSGKVDKQSLRAEAR